MSTNEDQPALNPEKLFDKFKEYFNYKFETIATSSKDTADQVNIKELTNKLEARDLTRPGNSAQFEFCWKVEIAHDKIKAALEKSNIPAAIEALKGAEAIITERKKTIKIADSSKAGWATVQELDKTGKDRTPEEAKRIIVAEEAALKSIERRKKFKQSPASSTYGNGTNKSTADRFLFRGKKGK